MEAHDHIIILITTKDETEAEAIARRLLEEKKAACVNIIPKVDSRFWWQGRIDSASESLLVVKTAARLLPEIINTIKSCHSYKVPEIIALPIVGGSREYLDWIDGSLA
ncbi:MAG: divalent-cation tolerance protein CutA [Chloroflexota bacterium]